jgi:FkbM family methyltransferase
MSVKQRAPRGRLWSREDAKIALRTVLYKRNLDLVRSPFPVRVSTTLAWLGADTTLDVGANVGQYGSAIRAAGFTGRIISCEPLQDAFGELSRRASADPRWTAIRTAVGAEPGSLEINIAANSYSSSALPIMDSHLEAAPGSETVGVERVPVTTVRELVRQHGIDPGRCLLKIDTQGYEAPVLDGAGELLAGFAAIQLELSFVPLYDGQVLYETLVQRLAGLGFQMYGLDAGFGNPTTGRTLQCDGLFVRDDLIQGRSA